MAVVNDLACIEIVVVGRQGLLVLHRAGVTFIKLLLCWKFSSHQPYVLVISSHSSGEGQEGRPSDEKGIQNHEVAEQDRDADGTARGVLCSRSVWRMKDSDGRCTQTRRRIVALGTSSFASADLCARACFLLQSSRECCGHQCVYCLTRLCLT